MSQYVHRFLLLKVLKVPKIATLSLSTHPDSPVNRMRSCLNSLGLLQHSKCNEAMLVHQIIRK